MRSRIVQLIAMLLTLSACAGPAERYRESSPSHHASSHDRRDHEHHDHDHHHDEPTPEEVYAGQIALLISAQVFACAFFVIILDGSCNFYASTGYYY